MALDILLAFVMATHEPRTQPRLIDAACAEAAAIWRPYGVGLRCTEWSPVTEPSALTVVVTSRDVSRPGADAESLGATAFDGSGAPTGTLTIFLDTVVGLVSTSLFREQRCDAWPTSARNAFLARGLGRVIAHEVGHYLLGPSHSTGLMRKSFDGNDLVDPAPVRFRLSRQDIIRLSDAMNWIHRYDEYNAFVASR